MDKGLQYEETQFVACQTKKIYELVKDKNFVIPHHQRDFSWDNTEVQKLLDDIKEIYKSDLNNVETMPHFLGSMVFIENKQYEIIDGQQRITTIMLLLASLKYLIKQEITSNENFSVLDSRIFSFNFSSIRGQFPLIPRLALGRSNDFFNKILTSNDFKQVENYYNEMKSKTDIDIRLFNTIKSISEHLKNEFDASDDQANIFNNLLKYIESIQFMIVTIEIVVQKKGVAYKIFEILNARGRELSAANLIKNTLLETAEAQKSINQTLDYWNDMIDELSTYESIDITDFLLSNYYGRIGALEKNNLYNSIKDYLARSNTSAQRYSKSLVNDYPIYLKLKGLDLNTDEYFTAEVIKRIKELNEFIFVSRVYPLLLIGRVKYQASDFHKLVELVVNFAFRYISVIRNSPDSLNKLVLKWSKKISGSVPLNSIQTEMQNEANDSDFKTRFAEFAPSKQKFRFFIVWKIEDSLSKGQGVIPQPQSPRQHTEHIMPVKPNYADWPKLFKTKTEIDEKHNLYHNRIGNITILESKINTHIKNKSFNYKNENSNKLDYQHSKLILPKEIKNFLKSNEWNFDSILERGESLAKLANSIWTLNVV